MDIVYFNKHFATCKAVNQVKCIILIRLLPVPTRETSCYYTTKNGHDIFVGCWVLRHFGSLAEDTLQNLNPISFHAAIKGEHLLVDKLIST